MPVRFITHDRGSRGWLQSLRRSGKVEVGELGAKARESAKKRAESVAAIALKG